jgi:hypothetical protein
MAPRKKRKAPGTGGSGHFYRIEVRPKSEFTSFRNQDVGGKGGLERLAGRRSSGSWATVSWLIEKNKAKVVNGHLEITDAKIRDSLKIRGPIAHKKGDVFAAKDRKNVPEAKKPARRKR